MNDTIINILPLGLAIPLSGWLIVSSIVFIWWFLDTDNRDLFTERHEKIAMVVFLSAFFTLFFVLGQGIEELFVFIPSDWGSYDEDRKFIPIRSSIAFTLAFLLSFFFYLVFEKFEKMRTESRRLAIVAETYKWKDVLCNCSRESLIEKQDETKTELENLRNRSYKLWLSGGEKGEIQMLDKLLEELEYKIQETGQSDVLDKE